MTEHSETIYFTRVLPDQTVEEFLQGWLVKDEAGEPYAMVMQHLERDLEEGKYPDCVGGGYICWRDVPGSPYRPTGHELVSLEPLTISPSLWHRKMGTGNSPHPECHGFIQNGVWKVA